MTILKLAADSSSLHILTIYHCQVVHTFFSLPEDNGSDSVFKADSAKQLKHQHSLDLSSKMQSLNIIQQKQNKRDQITKSANLHAAP